MSQTKRLEIAADASELIGSAVHSVGDSVREAAHRVRESAGRVAGAVEDKCEQIGHGALASFEHGRAQARRWESGFENAVRGRPLTSLLIAAAVGFVTAQLWKCGRSRD